MTVTESVPAIVDMLARVPLFSGCTSSELHVLATTTHQVAFEPGELLCVEGAEAPECYVIVEGEATCIVTGGVVVTVGADDVVGELGLLARLPRAATVSATTHLIAYAISREELMRLLDASPIAARTIHEQLRREYGG